MAFFDTFSLPGGPATNSDNSPWERKWRRDRDHGQVDRSEDWANARGTSLSPSTTTAGYMSWSRRESLRYDHALGYNINEHVWDSSHGRRSYYENDFGTYNDGCAEVPDWRGHSNTGPWARRQTDKEWSRVPLCDIHAGHPSGWYAEWSKIRYRCRHRELREHSADQSTSEKTGYAPCYGYYAYSTLPIRGHGTSCGERAYSWTKEHTEQNIESSEDVVYPIRRSSSDHGNQIFTDVEDTSNDDEDEEYEPLCGGRNSKDESNETNILPPLDRRCESIVDGESNNDVDMATESNRDQGRPHNPVEAPYVPQQTCRRTDLGRNDSFPPARAHWQFAESSSSNPSASCSPAPPPPDSCHPNRPSVQHEHTRHRSPFEAQNHSITHLPVTRTKLKHQFRQMQRVCRALRSERRRLLRERERLHSERQRLEDARI